MISLKRPKIKEKKKQNKTVYNVKRKKIHVETCNFKVTEEAKMCRLHGRYGFQYEINSLRKRSSPINSSKQEKK